MRVLLTTHQFLPEYAAGTEILTFETAKGLQQLGHEVCVFTGFLHENRLVKKTDLILTSTKGYRCKDSITHTTLPFGGPNRTQRRNIGICSSARTLERSWNRRNRM